MTKQILRNLPSWLHEGENLNTIVDTMIDELNVVIQYKDELKTQVQISTATAGHLDDIAKIFKLSRTLNETDAQFRARIIAFWPGFSGSGTISDLKETINRMTGIAVSQITITEIPDMKLLISFNIGTNFSLVNTVKDVIWSSKSGGVYPFFDIRSGFEDTLSIVDNVTIQLILAQRIYGQFNYGEQSSTY